MVGIVSHGIARIAVIGGITAVGGIAVGAGVSVVVVVSVGAGVAGVAVLLARFGGTE
ncbi:hypothetical protein [Streptodolium elevatio]|uniref:Uncharacterized protein n=1 Tax=Streptodolium elevatio TaxID=3157996 RepID=A0ABV3DL82_9ACTN